MVETGIVNKKGKRLLLMRGMDAGCTPIEDNLLLFEYGSPKEAQSV